MNLANKIGLTKILHKCEMLIQQYIRANPLAKGRERAALLKTVKDKKYILIQYYIDI